MLLSMNYKKGTYTKKIIKYLNEFLLYFIEYEFFVKMCKKQVISVILMMRIPLLSGNTE